MRRTTIYLDDEQKRRLEAIAAETGRTEAQLVREGIDRVIELNQPPRRKPSALFALADPVLDDPERAAEALSGFGER